MKFSLLIPFLILIMTLPAAAQETAMIRALFGTVELKTPGSEWRVASAGDVLERETLISTGFKSAAVVSLGNSTLLVRPLSRLSLRELGEPEGGVSLWVHTGRIRAEPGPSAGGAAGLTLESPRAAVSSREPSFDFDFDTVNLRVHAGKAALSGKAGRPLPISGGAETRVEDGRPVRVFSAARAELIPSRPVGSDFMGPGAGAGGPFDPVPIEGAIGGKTGR
jgi:hypothetical protein